MDGTVSKQLQACANINNGMDYFSQELENCIPKIFCEMNKWEKV